MHIKRKRLIIISAIIIFFSLLILIDKVLLPNYINKKYVANLKNEQQKLEQENTNKQDNNEFKSQVPASNKDKATYYVGKFIGYINKSDYNSAYNCLNEKFRTNNFGSVDSFKNYCVNKYSSFRTISLINYKINDDIIIAQVDLKSLNNGNSIIQFFTIREKNSKTGEFEISFGI